MTDPVAPPRRARAPWLAAMVAALAVAAVVVANRRGNRAPEQLVDALLLAADAGPRPGAADEAARALRDAAGEVRAGAWRVMTARAVGCEPAERARVAARDRDGRLRVFLVRTEAGSELHLYAESGEEIAARAGADGRRITDGEPLSRADADAAMARPRCELRGGP